MKIIATAILLFQVVSQQPYLETFEVRLHNLDVVVTDRAGKPVEGLTKDDFVVVEDGKVQEITNFAVYSEQVEDGRSRLSTEQGQAGVPVLHSNRPPRKFIFFLDEMSLHPASRNKLLKNATALLEQSMSAGDEAAVVRPHGENNVVQDFTGDIDKIVQGLSTALKDTATRIDTQQAAELRFLELQLADSATRQEQQFARRMYADMVRRRVEQRLGQLRALVASFAGVEGKKVLVLMTTSLAAEPGREARDPEDIDVTPATENEVPTRITSYVDLRPQIDDLGRLAAMNGVTIYSLHPDVPMEYVTPGREAPRRRLTRQMAGAVQAPAQRVVLPSNLFNAQIANTETTIATLAEKTGGKWYRGDGNIDDAFRQVTNDLRSYYSLAYRVRGEFGPRRVEVRIKDRPDLIVRTRTDVMEKSDSREMQDLVVANLVYPRGKNELGIRAVPGPMKRDRNLFTIPVDTIIPMEKLTFVPTADGKWHASFTVYYAAAGEKADFSSAQERREDVTLTEDEYFALAGKTFKYSSNLVVAPGHVKIAVGVLDRTSKLSGFAVIRMWAK